MKVEFEYSLETTSSPVSPWVHLIPREGKWKDLPCLFWSEVPRSSLIPPMPPKEMGRGYKLWRVTYRNHAIYFCSVEEMEHTVSILGQRVMRRSKDIVGSWRNKFWLSRLNKIWKPWHVRQRLVTALERAIAMEREQSKK